MSSGVGDSEPGTSLPIHPPIIISDGGPWATHDMACAVCHKYKAVIDVGTGVFSPCWKCQEDGWRLDKSHGNRLRFLRKKGVGFRA